MGEVRENAWCSCLEASEGTKADLLKVQLKVHFGRGS